MVEVERKLFGCLMLVVKEVNDENGFKYGDIINWKAIEKFPYLGPTFLIAFFF